MLKFIFELILIYLVLRFIFRFIFPAMVGNYVNKKISELQNQQQAYQNQNRKREGEVSFEEPSSKKNKKRFSNDSGEYVDYEEVK